MILTIHYPVVDAVEAEAQAREADNSETSDTGKQYCLSNNTHHYSITLQCNYIFILIRKH